MQLVLLLLLLTLGTGGDSLGSLAPILETFGGKDIKSALESAEQLRGIMSAFGQSGFGKSSGAPHSATDGHTSKPSGSPHSASSDGGKTEGDHYGGDNAHADDPYADSAGGNNAGGEESARVSADGAQNNDFPLAPVASIANAEILSALVRYFSAQSA